MAKPVLERAFADTYSIRLDDLFTSLDLALGTYRRAVSTLIPAITKVAWQLKKDEIVKAAPGMTRQRFRYRFTRRSYEREWGREYRTAGPGARILAFLFRFLPKIGPFKPLGFRPPTPLTEKQYLESRALTLNTYRGLLARVPSGDLQLRDLDFDTGQIAHAGEYVLAARNFEGMGPELRANVRTFYRGRSPAPATRKQLEALAGLRP